MSILEGKNKKAIYLVLGVIVLAAAILVLVLSLNGNNAGTTAGTTTATTTAATTTAATTTATTTATTAATTTAETTEEEPMNGIPAGTKFSVASVPADAIKIDGKLDEANWKLDLNMPIGESADKTNAAAVGTLYNDKYFYVAIDVSDAKVEDPAHEYPWENDSVEVYIDGTLAKAKYVEGTIQFIFKWADDTVFVYFNGNRKLTVPEGIIHKSAKTDKGYAFEIAIPWQALNLDPKKLGTIGFTAHVNNPSADGLSLTNKPADDWNTSVNWIELVFGDNSASAGGTQATTASTAAADLKFKMDGKLDEKEWKLDRELAIKRPYPDDTLPVDPNTKAVFGTYADSNYLYFGFDVTDSKVVNLKHADPWDDDSVDIYIDGNLAKGAYDKNTAHFIFRWDDDKIYMYSESKDCVCTTDGFIKAAALTKTGYSMEIAVPWSSLGLDYSKIDKIGFTSHVNNPDMNTTVKLTENENKKGNWENSSGWIELPVK